ncbi:FadR/GntR family transcriptional regulator [Amycolatopsis acidiphila]|nr:FCD domain-containing protein [Amycolatopsis acidiphila]GHG52278.1 GntR family transcriptional regulator [Amycolatopsis acidiphila]
MTRAASDRNFVRPKKMADMVADRIRRMIARGEIGDGQWLPTEPELMEEFGVSRPTLREAFRLLEADSLVTIRRGPPGGARVTIPGAEAAAAQFGLLLTLSGTTIRDVYEARMVVEPAAARELAQRGTAASRKALAEELAEARAAVETAAFGQRSVRFHRRVVELAGNQTLATVIGMLSEIVSRHLARAYDETPDTSAETIARNRKALRAYEKLVELVESRNGEEAEKFWLKHMRAARPHLFRGGDETQVVDLLY